MFSEHGQYLISKDHKVLFVDATGPWNLEAAQYFDQQIRESVRRWFQDTQWAMIALLHGQGVYTDESTSILEELHVWRVENGLRHIAIVYSQDSQQSATVTEFQFNSIYKREKTGLCETKYFSSLKDAIDWLSIYGYYN